VVCCIKKLASKITLVADAVGVYVTSVPVIVEKVLADDEEA